MKKFMMASAAALACYAAAAQAAPTITYTPGGSGPAAGTKVFQDFSAFANGQTIGTNAKVYSSSMPGGNPAASMPPGAMGNYAASGANGSFSTTFAPSSIFSFVLGSLDTYNQLILTYTDGTTTTYNGGQIIGLTAYNSAGPAYGNGTDTSANGLVTYTVTSGPLLTGVTFNSLNTDSFEYDTLSASGVPEPAAWGMMIVGFGLVGGVLRRRQTAVKVRFA